MHSYSFFFFNDTATTEIYTLSLHDALPIWMAAYALTRAGVNVTVLEAGVPWDNTTDSAMLTWPYNSPRRGASTKEKPFGEFDGCVGGWEIPGEPYTVAPGEKFRWWRARMVGGRT